jgi:hypothetical protein
MDEHQYLRYGRYPKRIEDKYPLRRICFSHNNRWLVFRIQGWTAQLATMDGLGSVVPDCRGMYTLSANSSFHDMYTLDDGKRKGVGSCMGLFLSVGHWPKILPQNSKGAN